MKKLLFLLLLISSTAGATDRWFWGLQAAGAADFLTTQIGRSQTTYVEGNPTLENPYVFATYKIASNIGVWYAARELDKRGQEKWADILRWSALSVQIGAAGWNASVSIRF